MGETWLRPNRRAIVFGCVPPAIGAAIGLWLAAAPYENICAAWRWFGALLAGGSVVLVGLLLNQLRRPRVAFRDGSVLFYLRSGPPIAVSAEIVEAFFLGQGPAQLPASPRSQTVNLVARLSQRHTEWARQDVKPNLGNWCDGYVTIRGTWCEPLGTELIRKLNRRLKEVQDEQSQSRKQ